MYQRGAGRINTAGSSLKEVFFGVFSDTSSKADLDAGNSDGVTRREREAIASICAPQPSPAFKPGVVHKVLRVGTRAGIFLLLVDDKGILLAS